MGKRAPQKPGREIPGSPGNRGPGVPGKARWWGADFLGWGGGVRISWGGVGCMGAKDPSAFSAGPLARALAQPALPAGLLPAAGLVAGERALLPGGVHAGRSRHDVLGRQEAAHL